MYDIRLVKLANNLIPLALIIHLFFGFYQISNEEIFHNQNSSENYENFDYFKDFINRVNNNMIYALGCFIILGLYIVEYVF